MLATLQNQGVKLEKGWTPWAQAATELIQWSKVPVDLADASTSIKSAAPGKLQPPEAAPIAPKKAPRKSKQVAAKTAKTVKTKETKKSAKTAKPAVTAKPATKTSRATSPRKAVVSKSKRRAS
jgi:hypothetical protein